MHVIAIRNLAKRFGRIEALKGVTLHVEAGQIYGLLGQNGAGKTTMVKILLGIIRHWEGEAELLGKPAGTVAIRSRIGYLPEDHRFPEYHTAYSLLNFYGQLLGLPRSARLQAIPAMLELVGLRGRMHYKIRTYSKGMKQRVGIAQALFHRPEVIFLDEPTDGVDPIGRRDIREVLLRLKGEGVTIFINSHLLGEIEQMCDRVSILHKGELIREGNIASLTQQRGLFTIGLAPAQSFPREAIEARGFVTTQQGDLWEIQLTEGQNIDVVVDLLRAQNLSIRHLAEKRQSLEDIFLKSVSAEDAAGPRRPGTKRSTQPLVGKPIATVVPASSSEQIQPPPR
jgi:ABC-2 type transport system ATP-binding protein